MADFITVSLSSSCSQTLAGFTIVEDFYDVVDALEDQDLEKIMDVSS